MRQVGPLLKLYEVGRAAKHKKIMDWGYLKSRQKQVTLHMQDKWKFGHVTNTRCLSLLNRHWTPNKVQNNTKRKSNWTPVQYAVCASKLHAASINHYNKKKNCSASVWSAQFCMKTENIISFGSTFVNVLLTVSSKYWHVNNNMHNKHEQPPTAGLLNTTLFRHNPRENKK